MAGTWCEGTDGSGKSSFVGVWCLDRPRSLSSNANGWGLARTMPESVGIWCGEWRKVDRCRLKREGSGGTGGIGDGLERCRRGGDL